ncbi:MAG TPA: hypothetical protein PLO23_04305 [Alphaproteobacteria bacterium]|nr:hypothetical protein [Alphaproteobacteria bacterium]
MASRLGYIAAPLMVFSTVAHGEDELKTTEKAFGQWTLTCVDPAAEPAKSCILNTEGKILGTQERLSVIFYLNADAPQAGQMKIISTVDQLYKPDNTPTAIIYQQLEPRRYGTIKMRVDEAACVADGGCAFTVPLTPEQMNYLASSTYLMFEIPGTIGFGFETNGTLGAGLKAMGYEQPALDQQ